ncbi:MAG: hypothetical protein OXG69_07365 [bacterium]|nr:hypothetical protein [bacterium]
MAPGADSIGRHRRRTKTAKPSLISYRGLDEQLTYWRLPSGIEVDFVVGDMRLAIEAKASTGVTGDRLKGLRTLAEEHPGVSRSVVCLESRPRQTADEIDIVPAAAFADRLWQGDLL